MAVPAGLTALFHAAWATSSCNWVQQLTLVCAFTPAVIAHSGTGSVMGRA